MNKIITAAMFALLALPSVASAADMKPYAGAGIGAFGLEFQENAGKVNKTVLGSYAKLGSDIGDYLGAELRIGSTASGSKVSPVNPAVTVKMSAEYFLSYLGKAQLPVTPNFKAYALLGASTVNFKVTNNVGFNQSQTKTGLTYGAGANYDIQDTLSVGGEWVQYLTNAKMSNQFGTNAKMKMWGAVVTMAYHF